ncbi:MAG: 50S rRNA methyltransferase [Euryarchaeota archaeon]|uniref:Putative ribosomal RNA large subunit methyltransferase H n=1 Tax=uncultured marine group II/III euryarchaeote AD1000_70_A08 TaxID=1457803 RepID=A0A075G238_9EURY|nr:23S rRNA (pseudouridine1915-N3)-methyltransferase (rlmH) [uncultured marine group II/III euryarchaeote AD1000_70_A08]MAJ18319.1 50S rRNA methyltransferase [Euryarchaeota archaeon]MCH1511139.1 23S rRNA (pseudouridine(1915)-N(3))-methyltransferase RlmH [Candidatus Thalassarchaeaceae archaeon]MDC0045966.1 23S rRNA (pseudouridine(1915)-N(3))-methyltransferase RlmH [Candidatus Poseidoniales archaeon]RCH70884.1 MAG: 50S rRNA methyltransferase [Candidatus Poseidoniales archaeon]|tara:strand:- start:6930 stop:7364 length:435 start_codon:yes stop_codon:yes gene_type:complete
MGRIVVHLHGRAKDAAFRMAISDYANRLSGDGVSLSEHRNQTDPGPYLESIVAKAGVKNVIVLEERGENLDSMGYAEKLKQWRLSSDDIHLVVGPPGGFGVHSDGMSSLSLGLITLPHELAAVVLLEQLYRASTIVKGLPYHRA